jgi:hypothetical protein
LPTGVGIEFNIAKPLRAVILRFAGKIFSSSSS